MSSLQHPSEFLKESQTAAAEEILSESEETTEERKSQRTDLLEQNASENVSSAGSQLCNQDRISSLKQENPDTFQIKEEQEEPGHLQIKRIKVEEEEHYIVQEEDNFFLKQESDCFMVTLSNEESHQSEPNDDTLHSHDSDTVGITQSQSKEIFEDVKKVIVWYDEDSNDCEHRLLDVNMKPEPECHRTDGSHQHVCEEEILSDLQLCNQERNTSMDQNKPLPPQIKEEDDEYGTSGQREQLQMSQETDPLLMVGHDHSEPETTNDLFFSHSILLSENNDQEGNKHADSKSAANTTMAKPFVCNTCGRRFNKRGLLLVHERSHIGEESLHCDFCGKNFKYASKLTIHMRAHTGEKPFSCETCGKGFSQLNGLKAHMRSHTGEKPFSCETCGKGFSNVSSLKIHMRTHTGEKPFSCETCGKCFGQLCHLNIHMRTHTGEKPFSCKTCGKCFSHPNSLKIHMTNHTSEKPL